MLRDRVRVRVRVDGGWKILKARSQCDMLHAIVILSYEIEFINKNKLKCDSFTHIYPRNSPK